MLTRALTVMTPDASSASERNGKRGLGIEWKRFGLRLSQAREFVPGKALAF